LQCPPLRIRPLMFSPAILALPYMHVSMTNSQWSSRCRPKCHNSDSETLIVTVTTRRNQSEYRITFPRATCNKGAAGRLNHNGRVLFYRIGLIQRIPGHNEIARTRLICAVLMNDAMIERPVAIQRVVNASKTHASAKATFSSFALQITRA